MVNFFESFGIFLESSDEESFINSIFESPFDTTAMLIYADWLDERDDKFSDYLRAAVQSANKENQNKNTEEPFYQLIKQAIADKRIAKNIKWKEGSFEYRMSEDSPAFKVFVHPSGQIMRTASDEQYKEISVNDLPSIDVKRLALLLLLEHLVDSHRITNPHGNTTNHNRNKKFGISDNVQQTFINQAFNHMVKAMESFASFSHRTWFLQEGEGVEMFSELLNQYIKPFEKRTKDLKFSGNIQAFSAAQRAVMETVGILNINAEREDLVTDFMRTTEKIMFRMKDHKG
jgi:uncharacterized protein (TIGR02996 family)